MGFNISGLLITSKRKELDIVKLLGNKITFLKEVDFEEATSSFKNENIIDVLQTETGTLIFGEFGQIYNISNLEEEIIQFMNSDVSDTFYLEKYTNGEIVRKYIYTQGEIVENKGDGIIKEGEDFLDVIWALTESYLKNNFIKNMFELKFKRYKL